MNRIYYQNNPNLDKRIVDNYKGQKEYRDNCRKIKGKYYIIDKDCFEVEGSWYRLSSGLIDFDHEQKKYVLVEKTKLVPGVVGFEKNKPVFGKFSENPYKNTFVFTEENGICVCIDYNLLIMNNYIEDVSIGVFYLKSKVNVNEIRKPKNAVDNTAKGYNIEDNGDEFLFKKNLYKNFNPEFTKDVKRYGKMLGDTTIGAELECSKGYLPTFIQNQCGVVICRDGSLNDENGKPGPEFVTVPMAGAKCLQTLSNLSKELSVRTELNLNCSYHLHLGNLPTTRIFLVSLYKLAYKLQNEIFQMFPFYKTNPEGIKNKNYNQKLPSLDFFNKTSFNSKDDFEEYINNCYSVLFSWLSEGVPADNVFNRKSKKHPINQKWNRHRRYYWINFMNTIFSERNTVEFRLHGPTTNQQKMVNWLFICNAIVRYANTHANRIILTKLPISLDDVLDYYSLYGERGKFLSNYLKEYVKQRKEQFYTDYKNGDYISHYDFKNDRDYEFSFNGVTHLF